MKDKNNACYDCQKNIEDECFLMGIDGQPMEHLFFFCSVCAKIRQKDRRDKYPEYYSWRENNYKEISLEEMVKLYKGDNEKQS